MNLEVNGILIQATEIRAESARMRQEAVNSGVTLTLDQANELLIRAERSLIDLVLLEQEAIRLGIVGTESDRRMRVETLVDHWTKSLKPPSTKDLRQAYKNSRDAFRVSEFVFVQQIVKNVHHEDERVDARTAMQLVSQELERGGDFPALVAARSDCPERGGAVGFISRGEMVPEFDEVVFALPLNRPSPVFETRFGFHIARVLEHEVDGVLPFEKVAPRLQQILVADAMEEEVAKRLAVLRSGASVRRVKL